MKDVTSAKTKRIANARALVGSLERWGDKWRFNYWPDGFDRMGIESHATGYHDAVGRRSQTLINIANGDFSAVYFGGSWLNYVND